MFRYREYFARFSKELGGNYSKGSGKLVEMLFNKKKNYLLRFTEASEIHLQISLLLYTIYKLKFVFKIVSHTNRNLDFKINFIENNNRSANVSVYESYDTKR